MFCERCGRTDGCTELTLSNRTMLLCRGCREGVESVVAQLVDDYDPESSTVYVQLSREEVVRFRDETVDGIPPEYIGLSMDQRAYIYDLIFVKKCSDWDLGLADEEE